MSKKREEPHYPCAVLVESARSVCIFSDMRRIKAATTLSLNNVVSSLSNCEKTTKQCMSQKEEDQINKEPTPEYQLQFDYNSVPNKDEPPQENGIEKAPVENEETPETNFVRLRGLPFSCTEAEIRQFLKDIDASAITFGPPSDGRPSGEAYVEIKNRSDVLRALQFNRERIGDRYIEVFTVTESELSFLNTQGVFGDEGKVVRLRGLPWSATAEDISLFFKGLGPLQVVFGQTGGRPSGDAFVQFSVAEDAQRAMAFNNQHLGSRYIEVFHSSLGELESARDGSSRKPFAASKSERPYRNESSNSKIPSLMSVAPTSPNFRGGNDFDREEFRRGNGRCKIYMRGLPYDANSRSVAAFFSPIPPTCIQIGYNESGRPSGDGCVEFENSIDANDAMEKNRSSMGRRYVELFPAHDAPPTMRCVKWQTVLGTPSSGGSRRGPAPFDEWMEETFEAPPKLRAGSGPQRGGGRGRDRRGGGGYDSFPSREDRRGGGRGGGPRGGRGRKEDRGGGRDGGRGDRNRSVPRAGPPPAALQARFSDSRYGSSDFAHHSSSSLDQGYRGGYEREREPHQSAGDSNTNSWGGYGSGGGGSFNASSGNSSSITFGIPTGYGAPAGYGAPSGYSSGPNSGSQGSYGGGW
ncbi:unnamed protein product [Caenorhabditis auriculariae]|uniref:RRM domain-containing protein n=1 Tax=Caenorhabditis auriculariae TaxID=2777116 RepID=A0A8S1H6A9_9PELO|nr:unnamed protein product [Caenorhabditis auriculariae]